MNENKWKGDPVIGSLMSLVKKYKEKTDHPVDSLATGGSTGIYDGLSEDQVSKLLESSKARLSTPNPKDEEANKIKELQRVFGSTYESRWKK